MRRTWSQVRLSYTVVASCLLGAPEKLQTWLSDRLLPFWLDNSKLTSLPRQKIYIKFVLATCFTFRTAHSSTRTAAFASNRINLFFFCKRVYLSVASGMKSQSFGCLRELKFSSQLQHRFWKANIVISKMSAASVFSKMTPNGKVLLLFFKKKCFILKLQILITLQNYKKIHLSS